MDKKIYVLSMTYFFGELNTIDIMILKSEIHKKDPLRTVLSINRDNEIIVDFDYGDCLASDYLGKELRELSTEEYKEHMTSIAKELTSVDVVRDDIESVISSSTKLRRFIKLYRNKNKIDKASKVLASVESKGLTCDFMKEALL